MSDTVMFGTIRNGLGVHVYILGPDGSEIHGEMTIPENIVQEDEALCEQDEHGWPNTWDHIWEKFVGPKLGGCNENDFEWWWEVEPE